MLSFADRRRVCCSGLLIAPDVVRELLDSNITESSLEDLVTVLCCLHDSTDVQHVVQNIECLSTEK